MLLNQLKEITGIQDSAFLHAALKVCACCPCSVERRPLNLSQKSGKFRPSRSTARGSGVRWHVWADNELLLTKLVAAWPVRAAQCVPWAESGTVCAVGSRPVRVGGEG